MSKLKLSPSFSIDAIDYANQANAILGIREAGKTYTAMKAAEQLMDAGIPIIVFDPVGVWQNLKIGTGTHKGYPVVVAGGEGADIRLTKENAVEIVTAAMHVTLPGRLHAFVSTFFYFKYFKSSNSIYISS